ncbi:MAG: YeeE/YedE thiosulfate transporter family protein [Nannocystaceae bacterium]
MMTEFTPVASTIGGLLIGLASATMLVLNGRIAGISGIVGGLIDGSPGDRPWRLTFVVGLLLGGLATGIIAPEAFGQGAPVSLPLLVVAGLLVGFGTRFGSGCTSGHGVCGISRMSPRSILATITFMATGAATVWIVRSLGGA